MLTIELPATESFNNRTLEFVQFPAAKLVLEHSLRSISKWEGKHHKSFFDEGRMSGEEFLDYIVCMTVNTPKDPTVYDRLREKDLRSVITYMEDTHTAKTFPPPKKNHQNTVVRTSEDYYSAMAFYGIPFECENWHFGRLEALIQTCGKQQGESGGGKRRSFRETQLYYDQINEARLKKFGTKG